METTTSDSAASLTGSAPLLPKKENVTPVGSKLTELNESRVELLNRIQGLKQDLQSWRTKLDTQVKVYRDELAELKKTLNVEVDQLRAEFKELKKTLHQQQEDVTASLKNLGLQEATSDAQEENQDSKSAEVEDKTVKTSSTEGTEKLKGDDD